MLQFFLLRHSENSAASGEVTEDSVLQASETKKKYTQGKFLSVADLSSSVDRSSGVAAIDMV
ncbi:putative downstream neighbor of Son-like protein, partial [Trifolium medium]|nr:putative downstream neighbor of Son-like protein [Trifolium medium]